MEWTLEEFFTSIKYVKVLKVKRLNRKLEVEGQITWEPFATVVLTILEQVFVRLFLKQWTEQAISMFIVVNL